MIWRGFQSANAFRNAPSKSLDESWMNNLLDMEPGGNKSTVNGLWARSYKEVFRWILPLFAQCGAVNWLIGVNRRGADAERQDYNWMDGWWIMHILMASCFINYWSMQVRLISRTTHLSRVRGNIDYSVPGQCRWFALMVHQDLKGTSRLIFFAESFFSTSKYSNYIKSGLTLEFNYYFFYYF